MSSVDIQSHFIGPLKDVAYSQKGVSPKNCCFGSSYIVYLKLDKLSNGQERLRETSNKIEATSLMVIKESFERGSLGQQIHDFFSYYGQKELVESYKDEMMDALKIMRTYTAAHQDTLCFKIKSILAKVFFFMMSVPQDELQKSLSALDIIQQKIEDEYVALPSRAELRLKKLRRTN